MCGIKTPSAAKNHSNQNRLQYLSYIGALLIPILSLSLSQPIQMNRTLLRFIMRWNRAAWGYEITCYTCPLPARMTPSFGNGSPEAGSSTLAPPSALELPSATWAHWATGLHWAFFDVTTSLRGSAGPGPATSSWGRLKITCLPLNWSSAVATSLSSGNIISQCGESMVTIRTFVQGPTEVSIFIVLSLLWELFKKSKKDIADRGEDV